MLRQYAAEHKIPYVDYHAALDNGSGGLDARISRDGCHPTLYGYTLMEPMVVEGINKVKRHAKPTQKTPQGGILVKEAAMSSSKAMLICPACDKPTRIKKTVMASGKLARTCKHCGEIIDKDK